MNSAKATFVATLLLGVVCAVSALAVTEPAAALKKLRLPSKVTFNRQQVGTESAPMMVAVSNPNGSAVTLGTMATSGPYKIKSQTCGASLGANASCSVMVTFDPTPVLAKRRVKGQIENGLLSVPSSVSKRSQIVKLVGTAFGTAPSPTPTATPTPTTTSTPSPSPTPTMTSTPTPSPAPICTTAAAPNVCGITCTNFKTDAFNCGGCDVQCPQGDSCFEGVCSSCRPPKPNLCNEQCTDVSSDPMNCGGCGNTCVSSELCQNGQCVNGVAPSPSPSATPAPAGPSVSTSPRLTRAIRHGAKSAFAYVDAGRVLAELEKSSSRSNAAAGPAPVSCTGDTPDICGSGCTNRQTDPKNCSACGITCPPGDSCDQGHCSSLNCSPPKRFACGDSCTDTETDIANCGGCGNVCVGKDAACIGGQCRSPDESCGSAYLIDCGPPGSGSPTCTNIADNVHNCGGCGHDCIQTGNDTCEVGTCCSLAKGTCNYLQNPCVNLPGTPDYCHTGRDFSGATNSLNCTNVKTDSANCGSCGSVCTTQNCHAGLCCPPDLVYECNGHCTDIFHDQNNCGGCGNICAPGEFCDLTNGHSCNLITCNDPNLPTGCSGICVNTNTDNNNCGACGTICDPAAGKRCVGGMCQAAACNDPLHPTSCNNHCVDLNTDLGNCGFCGAFCDPGQVCSAGQCMCPSGLSDCVNSGGHAQCTDTNTDNNNCGFCGTTCPVGQSCQNAQCMPNCVAPNGTTCSGTCVDVNNDPNNCGGCGIACSGSQGAAGLCIGGKCNSCYDPDANDDPFDDPDCD